MEQLPPKSGYRDTLDGSIAAVFAVLRRNMQASQAAVAQRTSSSCGGA